jgi:hypothetical protein
LNALSYLSLIEKYHQLPHTTNQEYKRLENLITDGEGHLSDILMEGSDVAFDIELSAYINDLSVEEINHSINDVKTAQHYESLIDSYHRLYRAFTAHCTLVKEANNLNIPQRFDYCEGNYQEYVAAALEEDQTNRKRLRTALNRAGQLLSAINQDCHGGREPRSCDSCKAQNQAHGHANRLPQSIPDNTWRAPAGFIRSRR